MEPRQKHKNQVLRKIHSDSEFIHNVNIVVTMETVMNVTLHELLFRNFIYVRKEENVPASSGTFTRVGPQTDPSALPWNAPFH